MANAVYRFICWLPWKEHKWVKTVVVPGRKICARCHAVADLDE